MMAVTRHIPSICSHFSAVELWREKLVESENAQQDRKADTDKKEVDSLVFTIVFTIMHGAVGDGVRSTVNWECNQHSIAAHDILESRVRGKVAVTRLLNLKLVLVIAKG